MEKSSNAREVKLIPIGNSKGIRLPKTLWTSTDGATV